MPILLSADQAQKVLSGEDLSSINQSASDNSIGSWEAAARGAGSYGTLGWSSQILGAIKAAHDKISGSSDSFEDLYRSHRDTEAAQNAAAAAQHPWLYHGAGIGASIAEAPLLPAVSGIGGAIKLGAGIGAVAGLGSSPADLTQGEYGQAAEDTLKGAALGAGGGAAGMALGNAIGGVGGYLSKIGAPKAAPSDEELLSALGWGKSKFIQSNMPGSPDVGVAANVVRSYVPESSTGAFGTNPELLGNPQEFIASRLAGGGAPDVGNQYLGQFSGLRDQAGKTIGDITTLADARLGKIYSPMDVMGSDGKSLADLAAQGPAFMKENGFSPNMPDAQRVTNLLTNMTEPKTLSQLQALKHDVGAQADWKSITGDQFSKDLYGVLKSHIDSEVSSIVTPEEMSQISAQAGIKNINSFQQLNQQYQVLNGLANPKTGSLTALAAKEDAESGQEFINNQVGADVPKRFLNKMGRRVLSTGLDYIKPESKLVSTGLGTALQGASSVLRKPLVTAPAPIFGILAQNPMATNAVLQSSFASFNGQRLVDMSDRQAAANAVIANKGVSSTERGQAFNRIMETGDISVSDFPAAWWQARIPTPANPMMPSPANNPLMPPATPMIDPNFKNIMGAPQ